MLNSSVDKMVPFITANKLLPNAICGTSPTNSGSTAEDCPLLPSRKDEPAGKHC